MQRHHKWVFSVLLVIIIIAFVFTIGNVPIGGGGGGAKQGEYFGKNLNNENDMRPVANDIGILFWLAGRGPSTKEAEQQIIFERIAVTHDADQLNFPGPSQEQFMDFVTRLPAFLKEDGSFDKVKFQTFLDGIESNPRMNREMIDQALSNNARAFLMTNLLIGPGYALPEEAKLALEQRNAEYVLETAELDLAKAPAALEADAAGEKAFYELHKESYRIPAKIEADLIAFPAEKYAASIPAAKDEELESFFKRNERAYAGKSFVESKDQVAKDYTAALARRAASQAAFDFALAVENGRIAVGSPQWDALLKKEGLSAKPLPAFAAGEVIAGVSVAPEALAETVRQLAREDGRSYSEPQSTQDGAVIFVRKAVIASRVPEYAEVADKVAENFANYRKAQAVSQYQVQALDALKKALASGESFDKAVKTAGLENAKKYGPFTTAKAPEDLPGVALYAVQDAAKGEVRVAPARGKNPVYVYVADKKVTQVKAGDPETAIVGTQLALMSARATQNAVMQQKVQNELARSGMLRGDDAERQ